MGVKTSPNSAVVQGAGMAMRMNATVFRNECDDGGSLPRLLRRYTHSRLTQIAQGAACNRFHQIDARLARWLLITRAPIRTDQFRPTPQSFPTTLCVRRRSLTNP